MKKIWILLLLTGSLMSFNIRVPLLDRALLSGTLHVILVADQYSGNAIAPGCRLDYMHMRQQAQQIARTTGLNLVFYPTGYTKASILNVVAGLRVQADDVVLFAYSGHGYRLKNQALIWPYLNVEDNRSASASLQLNLSQLHEMLKEKGARLTLTLGDCCNSTVNVETPVPLSGYLPANEGYKRLFLLSKGDLIASGCLPGEVAWSDNQAGGAFTTALQAVLADQTSVTLGRETSWEKVLSQTRIAANLLTREWATETTQTPQYQIHVVLLPDRFESPAEVVLPRKNRP